jgi:hexosaminidase
MKSEGIKDNHELQAYFNQRLHKILEDKGKKMMGWDEIIHPNLPKEGMVVQAWRNQKSLWEAARNGYKAVLSNGYYLDYKQSAGKHYSVDPFVIPGAISIEVDESNWKSWKGQMVRDETKVDMEIYLFGEGDLRRGIVKTMEGTSSFENPVFENNKFEFSIESNFGKINFDLIFNGDEITGTAGISVFKLDVDGLRNGGSDMENGAVLPKFEKIEPLTPEEEKNILGGEACMWSEMVDSVTILSRIWPRAAAVAEKMWTPEQTSKDTEDMYRRIELFDNRLSEIGLDYTSRQRRILEEISGDQGIGLFSLVESLQEDMFFNRMSIYDPEFYVTTPLNRMVDAILPESYEAYNFNILAREMKENDPDGKKKNYVQLKLMNWKNLKLDANLKNADERLKEILPQIDRVSTLAGYAYKKLNGEQLSSKEMDSIDSLLTVSEEAVGGTKIAILDGLIAVLKD